jgi:hypothetical protein
MDVLVAMVAACYDQPLRWTASGVLCMALVLALCILARSTVVRRVKRDPEAEAEPFDTIVSRRSFTIVPRRSFTVAYTTHGGAGGTYLATNPYDAAKKAARILCHRGQVDRLTLALQETTIGAIGKLWMYNARLHRLATPVVRKLPGGKTLKKLYEIRVETATVA